MKYLNSAYATDTDTAEAFDATLAEALESAGYMVDDFGGHYAWDAAVPPRDRWDEEISALVAHLCREWGPVVKLRPATQSEKAAWIQGNKDGEGYAPVPAMAHAFADIEQRESDSIWVTDDGSVGIGDAHGLWAVRIA